MRGLLVTATDTDVGKTILSAALLAAMAAAGERVCAHKPVVTGLDDRSEIDQPGAWPARSRAAGERCGHGARGCGAAALRSRRLPPSGRSARSERIDPLDLVTRARQAGDEEASLIVEGVGGLLAPLAEDYTVCDFAVALELPLLIAARPGLGTINHTLLTLQAARGAKLEVRAVVLTPWPEQPSVLEHSNRETIARLGEVEVAGLSPVQSQADFSRAGRSSLGDAGSTGAHPPNPHVRHRPRPPSRSPGPLCP